MANPREELRRKIADKIAEDWLRRAESKIEASPQDHAASLSLAVMELFQDVRVVSTSQDSTLIAEVPTRPAWRTKD
jgi:hypothetical protein